MLKKLKRIIFLKNIKNYNIENNSFLFKKKKIKNNFISYIINFFFEKNKKLKVTLNFLKIINFLINFILIKKLSSINKYIYITFIKNIFSMNKWFLNFNNIFYWLINNYKIIFIVKKHLNKNNTIFLLKKKRKKFLLKWIKNKLNLILKNSFHLKCLIVFLELILNFKKSSFFKFKNVMYKSILLK